MRLPILLSCFLLLLTGCGSSLDLDNRYSGLLSQKITGGASMVQGSVAATANVTVMENRFTVTIRSCALTFDVTAEGLANLDLSSRCTIDPEVDGGQTFQMTEGTASFGGGTLGVMAKGELVGGPERLNLTFAGQKK
ncbi:MAG: hypothetical protein AB8B96_12615 [Lysobacterales bacterium]